MSGSETVEYYDTLLKLWILLGKRDASLKHAFVQAMQAVRQTMVRVSARKLWYVGEVTVSDGRQWTKMQHAACALPGLLMLARAHGLDTRVAGADRNTPAGASDLRLARELMQACYEGHRSMPTGLAPARWHWLATVPDGNPRGVAHFVVNSGDGAADLGPETASSLYLLWKTTGDARYRDWAWMLFRTLQRWARAERGECRGARCKRLKGEAAGYLAVGDVQKVPPVTRDAQPARVLATLSYLWLTQADRAEGCTGDACSLGLRQARAGAEDRSIVRLKDHVFVAEGYPLPLASSRIVRGASVKA